MGNDDIIAYKKAFFLVCKMGDDDIIAYKEGGEPNQLPSGFVASWKID